nr:immunoglobulin light chain junction region [Macaca mulatta]MOX79198.1 immunoglobulin light chain junction region [Macaca mulatta]MOX82718.1 immunoglobulin light chain junction region [Macaca mulatta]MOX84131.1 immunoglobulin light chain junction region [Macaca mulatta]MOX84190.1 immunoglobulin light chain junction region [Macaca mulatta]
DYYCVTGHSSGFYIF